MKKYRKRPLIVEAIQYNGQNKKEVLEFLGINTKKMTQREISIYPIFIPTIRRISMHNNAMSPIKGVFSYESGNYIIKCEDELFYSCEPNVFAKLYKSIDDDEELYYKAEVMISDMEYNSKILSNKEASPRDIKIAKMCANTASVIRELLKRM